MVRLFKRTQVFQWLDSVAVLCACTVWGDEREEKSEIPAVLGIEVGSLLADFRRLPSRTVDWDRNQQLQCNGRAQCTHPDSESPKGISTASIWTNLETQDPTVGSLGVSQCFWARGSFGNKRL